MVTAGFTSDVSVLVTVGTVATAEVSGGFTTGLNAEFSMLVMVRVSVEILAGVTAAFGT